MQIHARSSRRLLAIVGLMATVSLVASVPAAHGASTQGDIVFVVDESGSMGPIQSDVRNNVQSMADQLTSAAIDARFGLVGYGTSDHGSNQGPHTHTDLTDLGSFKTAVDDLVASGGLEPAFDSIVHAAGLSYREDAAPCVVLVTDEPSNGDTVTQQDAIDSLDDTGATFFGIFDPGAGTSSADFDPLADQTGGENFVLDDFVDDPSGVLTAVGDACAAAIQNDVPFDVRPTSCPNPISSNSRGVLPAAIPGTDTLDVGDIETSTVRLVVDSDEIAPLRSSVEDVTTPFEPFTGKENRDDCTTDGPDGLDDLALKFPAQEVTEALSSASVGDVVVVQVTGERADGSPFTGEDVLWIRR